MRFQVEGRGFGVWGLGCRVYGLRLRSSGLGFGELGMGVPAASGRMVSYGSIAQQNHFKLTVRDDGRNDAQTTQRCTCLKHVLSPQNQTGKEGCAYRGPSPAWSVATPSIPVGLSARVRRWQGRRRQGRNVWWGGARGSHEGRAVDMRVAR